MLAVADVLKSIWGSDSGVPFKGFSSKHIHQRKRMAKDSIQLKNDMTDMYNLDELDLEEIQTVDPTGK